MLPATMNKTHTSGRSVSKTRFSLSPRGHSTAAAYRADIAEARGRGPTPRAEFELARTTWGNTYGLEPDDGAYFGELRDRGVTLDELREGLAVCGQTRDMVFSTITRLIARGFVERIAHDTGGRRRPTREAAQGELTLAQQEFEIVCGEHRPGPRFDRCMVDESLRQAASRCIAARRFLASFPGPAGPTPN